ncbi:hypothetical protein SKAU_G00046550 [Synaphobranchus kaupii]|uniref:Uncharacterized protein n=1 Tax=Synaphobranchus kaupii TaxID=118154 RepID=A0A9Q1G3H7_SYNKA|nr:hypothetical protein SKAU_G00046550 [Synaphobranchus kaupii]
MAEIDEEDELPEEPDLIPTGENGTEPSGESSLPAKRNRHESLPTGEETQIGG